MFIIDKVVWVCFSTCDCVSNSSWARMMCFPYLLFVCINGALICYVSLAIPCCLFFWMFINGYVYVTSSWGYINVHVSVFAFFQRLGGSSVSLLYYFSSASSASSSSSSLSSFSSFFSSSRRWEANSVHFFFFTCQIGFFFFHDINSVGIYYFCTLFWVIIVIVIYYDYQGRHLINYYTRVELRFDYIH